MSPFDPNPTLKKLKQPSLIKECAEQIKSGLLSPLQAEGELLEDYITSDKLRKLLDDVSRKLLETIEKANSPLRVSLVGSFASGKTATLCALLNKSNLLPRAPQPTSGNVVEVQIIKPGSTEAYYPMECILFSPLELEDMLRDYYNWLRPKLPAIPVLPEQPGFLIGEYNNLHQNIRGLLAKKQLEAKSLGAARVSFDVLTNLAHLYFILTTIKYYLSTYPAVGNVDSLVLPMPYQTEDQAAKDRLISVTMLDMQWNLDQMEPEFLDKKVHTAWQDIPVQMSTLKQSCMQATISNTALRALMPLYKRIVLTLEVELSEGWGNEINRIAFLDFPGVGADSRRDTYLCNKELHLAHVNLLFFLASRPAVRDAQSLLDIINETKKDAPDLSGRIFPIINFFDTYAGLPEAVTPDDNSDDIAKTQQAIERAKAFFTKERVTGVGIFEGFDVFDKSIIGTLYTGKSEWQYFMLSPIAAMSADSLSAREQEYLESYNRQQSQYTQLFNDLTISLRWLKKDRHANSEWIEKFERLQIALEFYLKEGGVTELRKELINKLKKNGLRLIAEDARPALRDALEMLERDLISQLPVIDGEDESDAEEGEVQPPEEARREVEALWKQMQKLTEEWGNKSGVAKLVVLQSRMAGIDNGKGNEYVSLLEWCEAKVLHTVLTDEFWNDWVDQWPMQPDQKTPLQELTKRYQAMLEHLTQWSKTAIQLAIKDTLEKLNTHRLKIDVFHAGKTSTEVSMQDVYNNLNSLFKEYVKKKAEGISSDDRRVLKEFFSLTTLQAELERRLDERNRGQTNNAHNDKLPFNGNQTLNWSAAEVMKIQRQLIMTLQQRIARDFAFYDSVFFEVFRGLLDERVYGRKGRKEYSITEYFKKFAEKGNVFDKLAGVVQDGQSVDDLNRLERRRKSQELIKRLLNLWSELVV